MAELLKEETLEQTVDKAEKVLGDGAEKIDVSGPKGDNVIEGALDRALKVARFSIRTGGRDFMNPLFIGAGGTGKTARVKQWAARNHINLVIIPASTMDDTDLGGVIAGNIQDKVAQRLASTEFDELDSEGTESVLFLDEWNRAPASVRGTLLTLIQDHTVPDPRVKGHQRFLKNFLFTVAAINPADPNYNTQKLDDAEMSRMYAVFVPPDPRGTLNHIRDSLHDQEKFLDPKDPVDSEALLEINRKIALAEKILQSPRFLMDNQDDIKNSKSAKRNGTGNGLLLTNRTFKNCLMASDGTKEDFLNKWNGFCNSEKKRIVSEILKNYKDIDDKANQALAGGTESTVFADKTAKNAARLDRLRKALDLD